MSAGPDKPATIVVEFPEPLVGLGQAIEIAATCEWHAGGTWSLPRFNVPNGIYQEGRLEIHAPSWLQLQARPLRGCIQTVTSAAGASRGNDRFEFQLFESEATLEISSGQAVAFLNEESGTQITVESQPDRRRDGRRAHGAGGGAPFSLTALVSRQWIIDSVETQPPEVLADRSLSARGSEARLQLKMTRPLTAQRPVRLVIRAIIGGLLIGSR